MRRRNPNAGLVVFWVKFRQKGYSRSITGLYRVLRKTGEKFYFIFGVSGKVNAVTILSAKPRASVAGGVSSATPFIDGIIFMCDACVFECEGAALL